MSFLEIVSQNVDEQGMLLIPRLKELFADKSSSYVHVSLQHLRKKGLAERIAHNQWRLLKANVYSEKITKTLKDLPILILTSEEKSVFYLLADVKIKCLEKNGRSRFNEEGILQILSDRNISVGWESLKSKLLALKILEAKGLGTKGRIYVVDENLLLEYLTDERLVKETIWREEEVRKNLKSSLEDFKKRAALIADIEHDINTISEKLSVVKLQAQKLENELNSAHERLNAEFPDKDKVLAMKDLINSVENIGTEEALRFFKSILGY